MLNILVSGRDFRVNFPAPLPRADSTFPCNILLKNFIITFLKKNLKIIFRVRHIKCYRAIALKLLLISKNVSGKSFIVREGRHTGLPYFLSVRR